MRNILRTAAFALSTLAVSQSFALEVGDKVPVIDLKDVQTDGSVIEQNISTPNAAGQYVILDFFQTTCGYCIDNLPTLALLTKELAEVATLRQIGLDRNEQKVHEYIKRYKEHIVFPVSLDSQRVATRAFGIQGTPSMFIVGPDGTIVYTHLGSLGDEDVAAIRKVVGATDGQ
jgi:peroxiredoxin